MYSSGFSVNLICLSAFFWEWEKALAKTIFAFCCQSSFQSTVLCWEREPLTPCDNWASILLRTQRQEKIHEAVCSRHFVRGFWICAYSTFLVPLYELELWCSLSWPWISPRGWTGSSKCVAVLVKFVSKFLCVFWMLQIYFPEEHFSKYNCFPFFFYCRLLIFWQSITADAVLLSHSGIFWSKSGYAAHVRRSC